MATVFAVVFVWFAANVLILLRLVQVSKARGEQAVADEPAAADPPVGSVRAVEAVLQKVA